MTEFVYVSGKVKWFRPTKPEEFMGKAMWKHTLYPDGPSLDKIRDLQAEGLKNVLKKDEDGYYINWNRPTSIKVNGSDKALAAPVVMLSDGLTPCAQLVGNGSDITTKLEVYSHGVPGSTTKKAKAARWLSTRIDNLIPYETKGRELDKEHFFDANEQRAAKGLAEQPAQPKF